jgi:hypothetical protein
MALSAAAIVLLHADLACPHEYALGLALRMVDHAESQGDYAALRRWAQVYRDVRILIDATCPEVEVSTYVEPDPTGWTPVVVGPAMTA